MAAEPLLIEPELTDGRLQGRQGSDTKCQASHKAIVAGVGAPRCELYLAARGVAAELLLTDPELTEGRLEGRQLSDPRLH